ncbi:MAG: hypothetical protein COS89_01270 [Deltaproteobacteria bacterium CG07_land_8_20_14_0_80_38_7]|nr:MAG: hypothetical protein COS89_01270 [Deltaproteobacteria bacterium CG07_land_8_20_14_0_80_38_7]
MFNNRLGLMERFNAIYILGEINSFIRLFEEPESDQKNEIDRPRQNHPPAEQDRLAANLSVA